MRFTRTTVHPKLLVAIQAASDTGVRQSAYRRTARCRAQQRWNLYSPGIILLF